MKGDKRFKVLMAVVLIGVTVFGLVVHRIQWEKAEATTQKNLAEGRRLLAASYDLFMERLRSAPSNTQLVNGVVYELSDADVVGAPVVVDVFRDKRTLTLGRDTEIAVIDVLLKTKRGSLVRVSGRVFGDGHASVLRTLAMTSDETKIWLLEREHYKAYEKLFGPVPRG